LNENRVLPEARATKGVETWVADGGEMGLKTCWLPKWRPEQATARGCLHHLRGLHRHAHAWRIPACGCLPSFDASVMSDGTRTKRSFECSGFMKAYI